MTLHPIYSIPGFTEPFSSLSHLLAAGVFLILGIWLVVRGRGSFGRVFALGLFIFSSVFLLSMSGVFHLLSEGGTARAVLQRLDHAGIFLLIAGTFTPVHAILFKGWGRWGMLALVWVTAITAITLKTIFFADISESLGLAFFIGLGWIGAVSGMLLYRRYGYEFIKPLVFGALAYTIGAVLEYLRFPEMIPGVMGPHEIFHIAVLFGLGFHFAFVFRFAGSSSLLRQPCPVAVAR